MLPRSFDLSHAQFQSIYPTVLISCLVTSPVLLLLFAFASLPFGVRLSTGTLQLVHSEFDGGLLWLRGGQDLSSGGVEIIYDNAFERSALIRGILKTHKLNSLAVKLDFPPQSELMAAEDLAMNML